MSTIFTSFWQNLYLKIIFVIPGVLLAVTFHEFAHGFVAYLMGDKTAKEQKRLTLNPIRHLDPLGTIMLLLFSFGWGKPVPISSSRFKNVRLGLILVSLAGPAANIFLAALIGQVNRLFILPALVKYMLTMAATINIFLAFFNLIPLPPLDGSRIVTALLPAALAQKYQILESYGIAILFLVIFLLPSFFFNLIRLPVAYFSRFLLY